jgi:hypothetical protein
VAQDSLCSNVYANKVYLSPGEVPNWADYRCFLKVRVLHLESKRVFWTGRNKRWVTGQDISHPLEPRGRPSNSGQNL